MTPKYGWCQLSWLVPPTRIEKHLDDAQASRCLPCRFDRQPSCLKPVRGRKLPHGFVGEFTQGEIPDPIPNSEVKTLRPMILLCGKVGDRRLDGPWWETTGALLFLCWSSVFEPQFVCFGSKAQCERSVAFRRGDLGAVDSSLSGSELCLRPFRVSEATRVSGALDVTD